MLELRIHQKAAKTGRMLAELVEENGIPIGMGGEAVVSYGVPLSDARPALNSPASRLDKYQELQRLSEAVRVPPHSIYGADLSFPILGRRLRHHHGKDIVPILANDATLGWRDAADCADFYTQYIPHRAEYRVWVFRDRRIASYRKVLRYPEKYRKQGCSWVNGFAFDYCQPPRGVSEAARRAVGALGYDFGAVDILEGLDGLYYVLEVNSAPGQETVRTGIRRLAESIVEWVEEGYPIRHQKGGDTIAAGGHNPTDGREAGGEAGNGHTFGGLWRLTQRW